MTRFIVTIVTVLFAACTSLHKTVDQVPAPASKTSQTQPAAKRGRRDLVLNHKYFEIHYDPKLRLARYVKYTVTAENLRLHRARRRDKFIPDPRLDPQLAVKKQDYTNSGYDRGHLAPAADFSFSQEANDATFVMSNMAPQRPGLNRKAWKALEEQVRRWACGEEKVTVITGPVLDDDMERLPSGVPVPKQFFKIVVDETPPRKVLAFIYNQTDSTDVMRERIVPLKSLEEKLHEDFEPEINPSPSVREPTQVNDWKEADC